MEPPTSPDGSYKVVYAQTNYKNFNKDHQERWTNDFTENVFELEATVPNWIAHHPILYVFWNSKVIVFHCRNWNNNFDLNYLFLPLNFRYKNNKNLRQLQFYFLINLTNFISSKYFLLRSVYFRKLLLLDLNKMR